MPFIQITTNLEIEAERERVLSRDASALVSEMVGKPESYVMATVRTGATLIFGGSDEPACHVSVASLGLPEDKTEEYSQTVCDFIHRSLEIGSNRVYIEFSSPPRHMWGYDRRTFG
jgi:hypothetical protein